MNPTTDFRQDEGVGTVTRRLMLATLAQAVVVLLAGLNLSLRFSAQPVGSFDLVRWREIFSLLVIVPFSVGIMFQVVWILEQGRRDAKWPIMIFGVGACLLGISMGVHEPINALPHLQRLPALQCALEFWDELFSHAVFYLAFAGISLALLWSQARNSLPTAMSLWATAVFGCIAIMAGVGIFLTLLPSGDINVDRALAVIALVLLAAEWVRKGKPMRQLPVAMVIEWSCLLAFLGLVAQRFLSGRW